MSKLTQLQSDETVKLIKIAEDIASIVYELVETMPESEQWYMQAKIRNQVVSMLANTSEGYGVFDPRDKLQMIGHARGNLSALASLLKVAHKSKLLILDPAVMVYIQKLISEIDTDIPESEKQVPEWLKSIYPLEYGDKK